ncbi:hypothetical protein [Micrococcus luteus]|uniref:hypothetical protein n=1 Tax=Micrococcus luteus TaxID=1270 RepID=UPI001AEA0DA8|nr:hypothetical protein [Micrococcus luteus]QTP19088.1 hypothetical protein J7660_03400 [Micrococcus luteus]
MQGENSQQLSSPSPSSLPEDWLRIPYPPEVEFWGRLNEGGRDETNDDLLQVLAYICTPREREALASAEISLPANPDLRPQPWTRREVLRTHWEKRRLKFHHEEVKRGSTRLGIKPSAINKTLKGDRWLLIPWSPEALTLLRATLSDPDHAESHRPEGLVLEHVTPIDTLWSTLVSYWESIVQEVLSGENKLHVANPWKYAVDSWLLRSAVYLRKNYIIVVITKKQDNALTSLGYRTDGAAPGAPFMRYMSAGAKWKMTPPQKRPTTPPPNPFAFTYPSASEWALLSAAEVEIDDIDGNPMPL